jgi:hypothetical protein
VTGAIRKGSGGRQAEDGSDDEKCFHAILLSLVASSMIASFERVP